MSYGNGHGTSDRDRGAGLEWSLRQRSRRLDEHCPLLRLAADDGRTPRDRVLAAARQATAPGARLVQALDLGPSGRRLQVRVLQPGLCRGTDQRRTVANP